MNSSPALTDHISALTQTYDDPGSDLEAILDVLADDLTAAVPSFLGLTMTLNLDANPVTLTAINPGLAAVAGASLELPLGALIATDLGSTVVFYARNPGAFVDLAEDTQCAYGLGGPILLDGQLPHSSDPCRPAPGLTGLADLSVINQAIGVLITRGHTEAEAHSELRSRTTHNNDSLADSARHLLTSTNCSRPRR